MIAPALIYLLAIVASAFSQRVPIDDISIIENPLAEPINSECKTTDDCVTINSECAKGICACREGYVVDGTLSMCLRVADGYNDECEESVQCSQFLSAGGVCENGVCACKDGYHYLHGRCHFTKGLNEPCKTNEECFVNTEYQAASCQEGVCKCSKGYYQREYSTCRPIAEKDGDDCVIDSDCAYHEKATCVSEKCKVETNESNNRIDQGANVNDRVENYFNSDGSNVLAVVGSDCKSDADCKSLSNSISGIDKKCVCDRAHFPSSESDACIPEIGENCKTSDVENKVSNSVCKNNVWTCVFNRVSLKSNQLCRKILKDLGDKCQYREQCQLLGPWADCVDGQCVCDVTTSHYVEAERFCWTSRKLGELCENDRDCHPRGPSPQTVCVKKDGTKATSEKICSCPEGTSPSADNGYCVVDKPEIGSYCEKNTDCKGTPNFICKQQECKCRENYFELEGSCLAGLNAACKVDTDCKLNNTVCLNGTSCQCGENLVASPDNKCVTKSAYQETCKYDVQCSSVVADMYCDFNTNTTTQAPKKNSEENEEVTDGLCECIPGYYYNSKACFMKKWLGETCTKEGECFAKNSKSYCRNGLCSCDFGFEKHGESCSSVNSAPAAIYMQPWLTLPTAVFLVLKALR